MEIITKRFIDDDISKSVYLKVLWKDNEIDLFHINVFGGGVENSWFGRFSQQFATQFSETVDETITEYKSCVKQALTSSVPTGYKFKLSTDTVSATFTWIKCYEDKLVKHGSVPIHLVSGQDTYKDLIDELIGANNTLQGTLIQYSNEIKTLNTELDKVRKEMNAFLNMKTTLEKSLYEKFVQLLNSKKRRIVALEENLSDYDNQQTEAGEVD